MKIGGRNLLSGTTQEYLDSEFIEYKHTIDYVDGKKTVGWTNTNNITAIKKQNVRLEAGKSYTFSFYAKSSEPLNLKSVYLNGKNNGFLSSTKITNNWERYHFTFIPTKTTESVTPHFYPEILKSDGSYKTFYVTDVQLESGNQLSDVNPSPEDIKRAIKSSEGVVKDYAETQKQLAINEANDKAQKALEPIKIRTTQAENSIRALEDALVLKATKTEVERTLNDSLKPVQTKVDEQQAQLQIMSDSINSKVSQLDYTIDKNNIVERLDNSDSERKQLSNQIADRVTRSEYENDVEQRLVNSKAEVLIEAEQTSNRVSKEVFNENSKTLERYTSEFINNVSTGMSFNYDDNGNIQSANVGPDGIKLKGDRVDITVNKDFNVLVNDVANKADETNIVNKINLSREGLEIDVNNVGIRGGDSSEYVHIKNDEITLYGTYTRNWAGTTETNNVFTRLKDGHIRFRNNDKDRSIYISDLGISTFLDGSPTEASGTIQFFDHLYDPNIRGLTIRSGAGVLGLRSEGNKIVMEADDTVNIGSNKYSIYLRPFANTRSGINEFQFYVKDNTNPKDTDGVLLFGELSDPSRVAGSGIRFRKQGVRGHENISEMEPLVYATNNNGDIGSGSFYGNRLYGDWTAKNTNVYAMVDNGELRITNLKGYNNGNPIYNDLRAREIKTTEGGAFSNHSGKNVYFGVGYNELRITANDFYNGGNTKYQDIRFKNWSAMSHEKYKYDIEEWDYNVLDVFKNELQLHCYKVNSEAATKYARIHHGIVLRDNSNLDKFPVEWRNGDGFDGNEIMFWNTKAIQELVFKMEEQNEKINKLEELLNEQTTS
ncbi:carbohydrate binding domain-containing protein [Staphylococcus delphini]